MTDLSDFADDGPEKPYCARAHIVRSPTTGKIAGFISKELLRDTWVYTTLRRAQHYYRESSGYAISDSILKALEDFGVERIIVHRGTDGHRYEAWEFTVGKYVECGDPVPDGYLEDEDDPQTVVPRDECENHWEYTEEDAMFRYTFDEALDQIDSQKRRRI